MPKTMGKPDVPPGRKPSALGAIAFIVPLVAILAAAGWYAARAWVSIAGPPMPLAGYVLAVLFEPPRL
jgi:hypothetical protein